jgi:hypothetical protein
MAVTPKNSASANQEEDTKPLFGFVPFTILNGVLTALVLTSIAVAIVLIIELDTYNYLIYNVSPPWLNFLLLGYQLDSGRNILNPKNQSCYNQMLQIIQNKLEQIHIVFQRSNALLRISSNFFL